VEIENQSPAPEIGIAPWAHHEFILGLPELAKSAPRLYPQIFLQTVTGTSEAPLYAIVWAKPGAGYLPGNESFESSQRNGETTGDWIVQRTQPGYGRGGALPGRQPGGDPVLQLAGSQ
jgi:hypothetical protein